MNTAIIRIFVWALVAVVLLFVLVLALNGSAFGMDVSSVGFVTTYSYPNSEAYEGSGTTLPANTSIQRIELDWLSGEIDIRFYDGDEISFYETAPRELDDHETLRYLVSNGKLTIRYCEPRSVTDYFKRMPDKAIKLLIPKNLGLLELGIQNVSSSIYVDNDDSPLQKFTIDTVSGTVDILAMEALVLTINSVSGDINMEGACKEIRIESVSASVGLELLSMPERLNVDGVSGSVDVKLPENDGFTAKMGGISGRLTCNFAQMPDKKTAVYKNGKAKLDFELLSGSVTIALMENKVVTPKPTAVPMSSSEEMAGMIEVKPTPIPMPTANPSVPSSIRRF